MPSAEPQRGEPDREPAQLGRDSRWDSVPPVAGEPVHIDAVALEVVESPHGHDARHVAVPEPQLVVRNSVHRRTNRGQRIAAVVEPAELFEDHAVADRGAAVRVAQTNVAGLEDLSARRGHHEQRGRNEQSDEKRPHYPLFSRWPPKALRIAERTRLPKSASPRDEKRSNSDAESTGTGTPSSTAACTVQRPSPESLTRPA